jgi:TusA-related sulfurtransferase/DNA-binding transcriptional ArsR family regulator
VQTSGEHSVTRSSRSAVSVSRVLNSTTRAAIYQHLRQLGTARTVREVADAFQLHPNVARTHLELLAQAGLVVIGNVKRPGGGRPAKIYLAREEADVEQAALDGASASSGAGSALVVRLLVKLLNRSQESAHAVNGQTLTRRAYEIAAAEGRRLMQARPPTTQAAGGRPSTGQGGRPLGGSPGARPLEVAAKTAVRALRSHAPDARVVRAGHDWVEFAGLRAAVELVDRVDVALAEALERGLLAGALAGAGVPVTLSEVGSVPGGTRAWRAQVASPAGPRAEVVPASTVDARGQQRETGVVHAMRAVTLLAAGEVLEVLTEGAGSPAAFARWVDRAGHELLGVERATDVAGRPAIRLLIRKGH